MTTLRTQIATRVSRFLIFTTISLAGFGCTTGASLNGPVDCERMSCGSGQLCVPSRAYPDDGGLPAYCVDVPSTCPIYDCDTYQGPDCSSCIMKLCGCPEGQRCYTIVHGRTLIC